MRLGFSSAGAGLAASILAHVLLIGAVAVPHKRQAVHGEAFAVDLVSPEEAAAAFADQKDAAEPQKQEPQKEETQPDWSQLQPKDPSLTDQQSQSAATAKQQQQRHQEQQAAQQQPQAQAQQQQKLQQQQAQQQQAQQQQAQQQQAQQQQAPQQQQPAPPEHPAQPSAQAAQQQPPENPMDQNIRLAGMLGLPSPVATAAVAQNGGEGDAAKADVAAADIAAFKMHINKFFTAPAALRGKNTRLIVRVKLRPDGTLASPPEVVGGSPDGKLLEAAVVESIKAAQPFNMLPAAKYNEWQSLDIKFTPDQGVS